MDITIDAYCINLKSRTDRKEQATEELKKLPFPVEFFEAINGLEIDEKPNNPPQGCTKINQAELGCLLSHLALLKKAKEKGVEWLFICEDDIQISSKEDIELFISLVPKKADMFYLGANHSREMPTPIDFRVAKCNFALTTHAICIRSNLFDTLIAMLENKNLPVDIYYAMLHKIYNVYCPTVNLAIQRESYSDIAGKVTKYEF